MKILCAYYDKETGFLNTDPEVELVGHQITTVHYYEHVGFMMNDKSRGIPPFDVVLMDVVLPWNEACSPDEAMLPTSLLMRHLDSSLIRGMGIFVPIYFETEFAFDFHDYHAMVADRTCWTPTDKRDWRMLLNLVVQKINQIKV
ncbi:MAG: hypothetical protein ABI430_04725 [Candidatus Taylorbacteria bacterium]